MQFMKFVTTTLTEVKSDMTEVKARMIVLEADMTEVKAGMGKLGRRLDNVTRCLTNMVLSQESSILSGTSRHAMGGLFCNPNKARPPPTALTTMLSTSGRFEVQAAGYSLGLRGLTKKGQIKKQQLAEIDCLLLVRSVPLVSCAGCMTWS